MRLLSTLAIASALTIFSISSSSCKSTAKTIDPPTMETATTAISTTPTTTTTTKPTGQTIPSVDVKTLEGKTVNIQDYVGQGKITVISFWATWCSPCKRELDAISEMYLRCTQTGKKSMALSLSLSR